MPNPCRRLLAPVALALLMAASPVLAVAAEDLTAVSEAYVGPMTWAKQESALSGLQALTANLALLPGVYGGAGCVVTRGGHSPGFVIGPGFNGAIQGEIAAGADQDLGAPGAVVTLDGTSLRALATFVTPRDFIIGTHGGAIDTNGYDLTLSGDLEAVGDFRKQGDGTLTLTGGNQWHDHKIFVAGGVLRGDTDSLQASIENDAVVEFQQEEDGAYAGVLTGAGTVRKTGPGTLTLSGVSGMEGSLFIDDGRLALAAGGQLGLWPAVTIATGANLDLTATSDDVGIGPLAGNGGVVLGSHRLVVAAVQDSVFGGTIAGPGGLTKTGSWTLALTGANTYSGGTVIDNGHLALVGAGRLDPAAPLTVLAWGGFDISGADGEREIGSLAGEEGGTVDLGANTLTVGSSNQNSTFFGAISGSGGIVKTGTGTLTLGGGNSYTGVTTVHQGTLAAQVYSLSSEVKNDATLILDANASSYLAIAAYDGTITGSGQLVKEGDGILWLRGHNSYSGGTTVNNGVLIGNTDSLSGEITNHDRLAFYQVAAGTYNSRIAGDGTLLVYGPGPLTLAGANTYTGGTACSGTLEVATDTNLGAATGGLLLVGGRLRISHDFSTDRPIAVADLDGALATFDSNGHAMTLAGPISGPGSLVKEGDGTLTLSGFNTFSGATEVRSGRLAVNGALAGDLVIDAGAEGGGTGVIGGSLTNNGHLVGGASIGPLLVGGNATFAPGSSFTVKVDPAGNADHLVLTGANSMATILGGSVDIQAGAGSYHSATDYTILTAPGGITGEFSAVTSNLAFLTPTLDYGPTSVGFSLSRNDIPYESVATTEDQRAVARVLGGLPATDGDIGPVVDRLNTLSAAGACQAFDSIAGRERIALPQVNLLSQRALAQVAVGRLGRLAADAGRGGAETRVAGDYLQLAANDLIASDAPLLYALAGHSVEPRDDPYPQYLNGLWLQGYGGAGKIDVEAPGPDYAYTVGGVALGYDRAVSGKTTLGMLGSFSQPRLEQEPDLTKVDSAQVGAYGSYHQGSVDVDLVATISVDRTESARQVNVGGLIRHASADYAGSGNAITAEFRYTLASEPIVWQPFLGMQWSRQRQEGYNEEGAGGLDLVVPAATSESLRSTLGMGVSHFLAKGERGLSFAARAGWAHEFQDQAIIGATLSGDPSGTLFSLAGADIPPDSVLFGVGLSCATTPALRLYLDLDSEFNDVRQEYTLTAGLGYRW